MDGCSCSQSRCSVSVAPFQCCTLVTRQEDVVTENLPILHVGERASPRMVLLWPEPKSKLIRYQGLESYSKDDEYENYWFDNS